MAEQKQQDDVIVFATALHDAFGKSADYYQKLGPDPNGINTALYAAMCVAQTSVDEAIGALVEKRRRERKDS